MGRFLGSSLIVARDVCHGLVGTLGVGLFIYTFKSVWV
jgi:hypothetical protein